jgi:hypothetical protein
LKQFNDFDDSRIYAGDEIGIAGDSSTRTKTLVHKGQKRAQRQGKRYSSHTSFLCIGNAAGESLPLIVIHKGQRIDVDKAQSLPSNALIGCNTTGYFIKEHFLPVLQHLNHHRTTALPILFIIDGAKTHIDLPAIVQQQSSTSNGNITPIVPPVISNLVSNFSLPSDDAHPPSDKCPTCGKKQKQNTVKYRHRQYT